MDGKRYPRTWGNIVVTVVAVCICAVIITLTISLMRWVF